MGPRRPTGMKMSRSSPLSRWSLSLLVAGALVASGCGDDDPVGEPVPTPTDTAPPDTTPDDMGGDNGSDGSIDGGWVLVRGQLDGEEIELVDGWDVTLNIDGDEIGGTAACNGYGGTVAVGDEFDLGGSFVIGELSWTEMGCEPAVMELEQQFLRALGEIDSYELADTLSLAGADVGTSLTFERVEPVDDTALVGVTWVLDTLITGDTASNSTGVDAAFLEFSDDGMLVGSTGCRRLEGEWSLQGATIEIPILSAIDDPTAGVCSPESQALDGDIISVIESGTTAQIEGNRLTLTASGGDGLSFVADTAEGSSPDQSAPASPDSTMADDDSSALDPSGGVDGSVVYAARPSEDVGEEALLEGAVSFGPDRCVRVDDVVLLWRFGTRWQAEPAAVLVDGLEIADGDRIAAGGGFHDIGRLSSWTENDGALQRLRDCQPSSGDGVFVIQHPVERLG